MEDRIKNVLEKLEKQGFEAWLVGGYVRDFLLGRTTTDIDIATNATPSQIKDLFHIEETFPQERFGNVVIDGMEITTYRKDTYNIGNRFPQIEFVSTLEEDALRRDFTINALYMNKNGKILDPTHRGLQDLKDGKIRTIGDPKRSFREDPLRMIRAVRFSWQLNFTLDPAVEQALKDLEIQELLIKTVSEKRIEKEIEKGLSFSVIKDKYDFLLKKGF